MQLTKNFNLDEFRVSDSYPELAKEVEFSEQDKIKIQYLCLLFLQPVRDNFGSVRILSGKRTPKLNSIIRGSVNSDHLYGDGTVKAAVDFTCAKQDMHQVYTWLKLKYTESFGQLIYYKPENFIHISLVTPEHKGEAWINE